MRRNFRNLVKSLHFIEKESEAQQGHFSKDTQLLSLPGLPEPYAVDFAQCPAAAVKPATALSRPYPTFQQQSKTRLLRKATNTHTQCGTSRSHWSMPSQLLRTLPVSPEAKSWQCECALRGPELGRPEGRGHTGNHKGFALMKSGVWKASSKLGIPLIPPEDDTGLITGFPTPGLSKHEALTKFDSMSLAKGYFMAITWSQDMVFSYGSGGRVGWVEVEDGGKSIDWGPLCARHCAEPFADGISFHSHRTFRKSVLSHRGGNWGSEKTPSASLGDVWKDMKGKRFPMWTSQLQNIKNKTHPHTTVLTLSWASSFTLPPLLYPSGMAPNPFSILGFFLHLQFDHPALPLMASYLSPASWVLILPILRSSCLRQDCRLPPPRTYSAVIWLTVRDTGKIVKNAFCFL